MNAVEIRSNWQPAEAEEPLCRVRNAAEWFGSYGSGAVPLPSGPMALAQEVGQDRDMEGAAAVSGTRFPGSLRRWRGRSPEGEEVTAV